MVAIRVGYFPKNFHSREREYRKIFESFPGIPGNGNENFFLRTKAYFYVFQRFILSFHDFIQAVGPNTRPTCQI